MSLRDRLRQLAGMGGGTDRRRRRRPSRPPDALGPSERDYRNRMYEASHASPPTDHSLEPVDDRGLGTFADFVAGRRPAEGVAQAKQRKDNQSTMQWELPHGDGAVTIVTAAKTDSGEWQVTATERNPAGRDNGIALVGTTLTRAQARRRALDWMEDNPDGIPFHAQSGQFGTAGQATGGMGVDELVRGGPAGGRDAGGRPSRDGVLDFTAANSLVYGGEDDG